MRLDWNRTRAVRIINAGHGHAEFVPPILKRLEDAVRATSSFMQVCDWWDLQTYDPAFRTAHGEWIDRNKAVWSGAAVLVRSKLVALGLAVANAALGGKIKTYSSRPEFEAIVREWAFQRAAPLKLE